MPDQTGKSAYIPVTINEGFYYNASLQLPTIVNEYERVEKIFDKLQYMACLSIHIDSLNKVEYKYGSVTYNELLSRITLMLKQLKDREFRQEDVLLVDIYDIDTFVIFLSPPRKEETKLFYYLEHIAERIRVRTEKQVFDLLYPYLKEYVRPTIGFAMEIRNPMVSTMRLIMKLMSNAKQMGEFMGIKRQYFERYTLQKVILEKSVRTVFQPIVDMKTLDIIGYEALTRGEDTSEFANPTLLFLIAAECGLSFELDRLCRKTAFESARNLTTDKKIFVNTLSMTIHDPEFRGMYLKELLEDLEIKPENVVFEVSEKLAIDNYDIFRTALKDYTDIGIIHADDDIGTGYSDLERIMELNPGYMKIDMSFARDVDKSYVKQEIIRAIVNLGKNINSRIIVEGVETPAEFETLKKLGVAYGQGYLFGKPSDSLAPACNEF